MSASIDRSHSPDPGALLQAAIDAKQSGQLDRAAYYCELVLQRDPGHRAAHELLLGIFMHGPRYHQVLPNFHRALEPRTYIEIGVERGASLQLVGAQTTAIGIDPNPLLECSLPANVSIFAETSDAFFARPNVRELLGGLPLDLAFIDGMHHFEYALRDFVNLERLCHRNSVILIHDCFPLDRRTAERERQTTFWSGDVWRLLLILKRERPDLRIHTIATPPTGLCVVTNLDPQSRALESKVGELTQEFMMLDFEYLGNDRASKLNLFPNDWPAIQGLLPACER